MTQIFLFKLFKYNTSHFKWDSPLHFRAVEWYSEKKNDNNYNILCILTSAFCVISYEYKTLKMHFFLLFFKITRFTSSEVRYRKRRYLRNSGSWDNFKDWDGDDLGIITLSIICFLKYKFYFRRFFIKQNISDESLWIINNKCNSACCF